MVRREVIIHDLESWIESWIDNNINSSLRIDDVVKRSGYSKWYLQKMFSVVKKKTLGRYIRDLKLFKAACDLVYSDETIIAISLKYGYDSQSSFTRTFTQNYVFPPSEFRRLCRDNPGITKEMLKNR
ncbi:helix-turn-helix domain-containing protein [Pantoea cypripedii]|uniref:HTH araC/xylS-type domain-containing protein n=1 Tax=Pantoea cypripedii TaxID=55209 RepID=A0A1X1EKW0_PANCY|nr:helix-turn-helix domain-containing protein [Pantoea cypripedii]MBP2199961.1 AraC family multidrug resistance transcriptional activator [Pantoea cypripedii]ORM89580.1 hypothetical protein HA50_23485 [Pantoea cypripedii]